VIAFVSSIAVLDGPAGQDFARELGETGRPAILSLQTGRPFDEWSNVAPKKPS
jgi:hypothetical protein